MKINKIDKGLGRLTDQKNLQKAQITNIKNER